MVQDQHKNLANWSAYFANPMKLTTETIGPTKVPNRRYGSEIDLNASETSVRPSGLYSSCFLDSQLIVFHGFFHFPSHPTT